MTGKTHVKVSTCFALIAVMSMNFTRINYYVYMIVILMCSSAGAKFPDLDHSWCNIPDKNVVKWVVNKLIRYTGGRHRSRHTHSIDVMIVTYICSNKLVEWYFGLGYLSQLDREILLMIIIGFWSGWLSHLYADALTYDGIYWSCLFKYKLKLVPKKLFGIKFKTGEQWESFVYRSHIYINGILGVWVVLYPIVQQVGII